MSDWPKELHGHLVDRKVDFVRRSGARSEEGAQYTYTCVKCGVQVAGPDDPRLVDVKCQKLTHDWQA